MPSLPKPKRPKYLPRRKRGNQEANQRLYKSTDWVKTSKRIRQRDTIANDGIGCCICYYLHTELGQEHYNGSADHCDHIIAVSEGGAPLRDERNLWGICVYHHNVKTGLEAHGLKVAVRKGIDGLIPVDIEEVIKWVLKLD